jgi:hypothetical protein
MYYAYPKCVDAYGLGARLRILPCAFWDITVIGKADPKHSSSSQATDEICICAYFYFFSI